MSVAFESYDLQLAGLRSWVNQQYIRAFGLTPCAMLDAGCGNGFWASLFVEAGFTVTAIDLTQAYLVEGHRRWPAIRFIRANLERELPLRGRFPLVFCRALSHLSQFDSLAPAVPIFARLLGQVSDDGVLLVAAFSDQSRQWKPAIAAGSQFFNHRAVDFAEALVAAGGTVRRQVTEGRYLQFAAGVAR